MSCYRYMPHTRRKTGSTPIIAAHTAHLRSKDAHGQKIAAGSRNAFAPDGAKPHRSAKRFFWGSFILLKNPNPYKAKAWHFTRLAVSADSGRRHMAAPHASAEKHRFPPKAF